MGQEERLIRPVILLMNKLVNLAQNQLWLVGKRARIAALLFDSADY
jgi:hypothetical protein